VRPSTGADPRHLLEHYEALRREALEGTWTGERGHGLALFLARGMSAWLDALRSLTPSHAERWPVPAEEPPGNRAPAPAPSVRMELTMVLAGMVLAVSREAGGVE
jgi:hypothetical protein